ncbi:hypothetical protein IRA69_07430 [Campylobacter hepaticus]|nr:hypothetical protein IRA69_07360 [Campylobacter hepaticus]QOW63789.1 hypothetical protein IRA69_07430 [Campylobacter hepaticus]
MLQMVMVFLFEGKDTQIGNFINTGIIVGNHSDSSNNASVLIGRPDKKTMVILL